MSTAAMAVAADVLKNSIASRAPGVFSRERERVRLTFVAMSKPDNHSYMICLFPKVPTPRIP